MNMICGIVNPTLGSVEFHGKDFDKHRKELIVELGYIPQELAIHGNLKAWENVELFTSLYGIRGAELKKRIDELVLPGDIILILGPEDIRELGSELCPEGK